jgi:hypothetical protein
MRLVNHEQAYFQQIRLADQCDAADGRVVGHMLIELAQSPPKDVDRAIRQFVDRTAMLRESGFRHIGAMLAQLLRADTQGNPDEDAPITALNPSALTEKQASAIGSAIAQSKRRSHVPATALRTVVESCAVLCTMQSRYAWFVPMLEVLTAHETAEPRRSVSTQRLGSIAPAEGQPPAHVSNVAFLDVSPPNFDGS